MKNGKSVKTVPSILLLALLLGLVQTSSAADPNAARAKGMSPEGLLAADGTLKPDGSYNGALDLEKYSVRIDPERGPVFTPAGQPVPSAAAGAWSGLGEGSGAIALQVTAIAVIGTDIYVAGLFTNAANIPEADYIAKWDGTSWSALGSNGAGNGALSVYIRTLAASGSDLYVGGDFTNAAGIAEADYIAKWNGTTWSALGSNGGGNGALGSLVTTLAVSGADLYAGGGFTNAAGIAEADYIAKWNGATWSALGSNGGGNGALGSIVTSIAIAGPTLYAGGYFTNAGGILEADYIARWNGTGWSSVGSTSPGNGDLNGVVLTVAASGSTVYAGGNFTNAAGIAEADYIAKWNGSAWSAPGSGGAPLNGSVSALAFDGSGNLYAGGSFTNVSNNGTALPAADYIAKWDGTNWSALGSNGAGDGAIADKEAGGGTRVSAIAFQGGRVLAGGNFNDVNDGAAVQPQADFFAAWDGAHWAALGSAVNGALGGRVNAVAVVGTDIYVGGQFVNAANNGVNIAEADYIAKWDGTNWSALGSDGAGGAALSGIVFAMAVSGTDLYVGGGFYSAASLPGTRCLAKWDGSAWSGLGATNALTNSVYALAVSGTDLYAGGDFTDAAGIAEADYIAKWNGSAWSALGSNGPGTGALNQSVLALAASGTDLYAGGFFTNASGIAEADYIAKWDGATWSALGSNGAGSGALDSYVLALAASGNVLYVGGAFGNINNNGSPVTGGSYIARWDGTNWSALGSDGAGSGALPFVVNALALYGADLYVGGGFTSINNNGTPLPEAAYIAKWDGANWSALGSGGAGKGALDFSVQALALRGGELIAGGSFHDASNNGTAVVTADFVAVCGIDFTPPSVASITRASASPTSAASVDFTVVFSEAVTGVDAADFSLTASGVTVASVTGVSGSGATYSVAVATGAGSGTLRLDLADDDSIADAAANPLGGAGAGNGDYSAGEAYTISDEDACTVKLLPGTLGRIPGDGVKTRWLLVAGQRGTQFDNATAVEFDTPDITVRGKNVFFKRFLLLKLDLDLTALEPGDYSVLVGTCSGSLRIRR